MRPIHPYLITAGTIVTETDMGHEGNLKRACECYDAIKPLLVNAVRPLVVHETPPVGDGMSRPESSLLAAVAIRIAAHEREIPVHMVAAQRAKRRLTGRANATKPEMKDALARFWPHLPLKRPYNEHVRDTLALGIVAYEEYES